MKTVSVLVPAYNEEKSIRELLARVRAVSIPGFQKEIIVVDDCSTDGTCELLKKETDVKAFFLPKNVGKGGALRECMKHATGEIMIVQDADLEYSPEDYPKLVQPIVDGKAEVVYGTRFSSSKGHLRDSPITYFLHVVGNAGLTLLTNVLYVSKLTDMETCYKAFTRHALHALGHLRANRFDFEPEITAKFLKRGFRIHEVPITYYSRGFSEGKKITWKDGVKAAWYLIKYRFVD